ncbi:unnamed protein product [Adineta steineri]|uniref:Uncharacterized protein n=1 Tax=Adineta steineri TaxID=433720 RepID=A0A815IRA9_9BILA|nr:unnamed protein product [Adineta steineri]CAF1416417.1 unnamed protein product [Adineta steineri]CAF3490334.1 unnamed protein product [Adineta steineri]CAF3786961.1 unnamed protein product [Adineta steineri]
MEIDFAHSHNPTLFGSLSVSPPASMFDSFSPLLHLNDDFLDVLNPSSIDDDTDDWMKPLLLDQLFEHDFLSPQLSIDDIEVKQEKQPDDDKRKLISFNNNCSFIIDEKFLSNNYSQQQHQHQQQRENELMDFFQQHSEQQLPPLPSTTTTVRLIHQPKIEPAELPTTLYVSGNELQFHPIVTTNNTTSKTIGHTYTTTTSSPLPSVPIQPSVPIVPARVLKGKKFKRGGRVSSRATSRSNAAAKRRLNSTAAEPKASVVIIAEDATRIDSKTTTLGLSSTGSCSNDSDLLKSSSSTTTSTRSSTRRRVKSTPREVILFRNGTFVSKEPITKQQPTTTLCFETTTTSSNNTCPLPPPPLHQQQITATGLQAAAQIVACNVLRQATLNDALIEQLIKREPANNDDDFPIYCYSSPSLSSASCTMTAAMDEYENSCSTTLKILGCNTTAPLHSTTTTNNTTTTTIELLTFAALQQQQQHHHHHHHQPQFCYIKQEPGTTTTTTTTFLLPRLLPQ